MGLAAGVSSSRHLLRGTWPVEHGLQSGGIHNLESSKSTSATGENEQMESNCRPVVGTLLTNTQVAVYRAFWNRMWLGSWGQQSNYQHLSFLFNEGECGKQPCFQQWDGERCQGCVASPSTHSRWPLLSCHPGPVFPDSWILVPLWEKVGILELLGCQSQDTREQ